MLIDWFTVFAQIINFLILVWLLKRFLYRPILNAIDTREKHIALALADADAKKTEAQQERDEFRHKNEAFEQQRAAHVSQMMAQVKQEHQRLLDSARQESDALRIRQQQALVREQHGLNATLSRDVQEEVFAIARKTLSDLAGVTLEERVVDVFLRRLYELNDADMAELKSVFKAATSPLRVRSAFPLSVEQGTRIDTVIKEILGEERKVQFETMPELICGLELSSDGHKLAWSIADYVLSLKRSLDERLKPAAEVMSKQNVHG